MQTNDPLISTYEAMRAAIRIVHGANFNVTDEMPDATIYELDLPAANIMLESSKLHKAFMREFVPHSMENNKNGTYTIATETARFDYFIQISFFAPTAGYAQKLSNEFLNYIELRNEVEIPNNKWGDKLTVLLQSAPDAPQGTSGLYWVNQHYKCIGKFITEDVVNAIDVANLRFRIGAFG